MPSNIHGCPEVTIVQWREILKNWHDGNQRQQFCDSITVDTPMFDFQSQSWIRPKNMMTAISNRNSGFCYLEDQVVAPYGVIVYQVAPNLYIRFDGPFTQFFKLTGKRIKTLTTAPPNLMCNWYGGRSASINELSRFTDLKKTSDEFLKILFNLFVIYWTDWRDVNNHNRFGEVTLNEYTDMNRRIFDKRRIYGHISEQVMAEIQLVRDTLASKE